MELRRFTFFCAISICCLQLLTAGICWCAEAPEEGFTLQLMFGADRKACQKLQEHLTAKGFDAQVYESVNDLGAKMYRVRVGTFKTKDEAAASASQLRADNFQCFVRPISSLPIERTREPETARPGPAESEPDPAVAAAGRDTRNLPESLKTKIKAITQADNATGAETNAPEDAGHIDETDLAEEGILDDEGGAVEQPQLQAPETVRRLAATKRQSGDPSDNQSGSARSEKERKPPAVGVARSNRPDEEAAGDGQSAQNTKIYKYYDGQGILNLTNSYKKIPMELRKNIREIIVFPVRIIAFDARDLLFKIEMGGEEKKLRLVDVKPGVRPPQGESLGSFKERVHNSQCRLIYDPGSIESGGLLLGSLYLKTGESVGLDMVRRGIALSNQDKLPANKRQKFLDAQEQAKNKKMGIWQ